MAFNFNWSPLTADEDFYQRARDLLTTALNKSPKPPIIVDDILVTELNLGSVPPELEILEIGDLAEDRFRGIFKMCYSGDAFLTLRTRVQVRATAPESRCYWQCPSLEPIPPIQQPRQRDIPRMPENFHIPHTSNSCWLGQQVCTQELDECRCHPIVLLLALGPRMLDPNRSTESGRARSGTWTRRRHDGQEAAGCELQKFAAAVVCASLFCVCFCFHAPMRR